VAFSVSYEGPLERGCLRVGYRGLCAPRGTQKIVVTMIRPTLQNKEHAGDKNGTCEIDSRYPS